MKTLVNNKKIMKKSKKIIFIFISLSVMIWATYAATTWKAWWWVKWIAENDQSTRFTDFTTNTSDYGTWYYLDTYTNLKWAAQDSWTGLVWSTNSSYTEPTWNWTSYTYPSWRTDTDYPAFKHCTDKWSGWRLPTKRELFSIMTDKKPDWMSYYTALPSITNSGYWSSTTYDANTAGAWYGNFNGGYTYYYNKTNTNRILCIHD